MTRRPSSTTASDRARRHSTPSIRSFALPVVAVLALVVAGCGSAKGTVTPVASAAARASGDVTDAPSVSDAGSATPTAAPAATDTPSEPPSGAPSASGKTSSSAAPEPASDCTGTDENRTFYGSVAAAVDWTVYCPVLPSGWFVEAGQYWLAGGGRLAITYRGPGGSHFTLDEGAWCTDGSGCVPSGPDLGSAAFGDRDGSLIAIDGGNFAIAVDAGAKVSWLLSGDGLDEATVRTFGAALIAVGG